MCTAQGRILAKGVMTEAAQWHYVQKEEQPEKEKGGFADISGRWLSTGEETHCADRTTSFRCAQMEREMPLDHMQCRGVCWRMCYAAAEEGAPPVTSAKGDGV